MVRTVKRETESRNRVDDTDQLRTVKREKVSKNRVDSAVNNDESTQQQDPAQRRELRSKYLKVKNLISDKRDDIVSATSNKFNTIIKEVENLHLQVRKPREQVADAEALLDITNQLVTSVKSQSNEGITPVDFVTCLVTEFGISTNRLASQEEEDAAQVSISWRDIGVAVSPIFRKCPGCFTMLGPMNTELKQRKAVVHRRRAKLSQSSQPEEVDDAGADEKTDTDKNMSTMFEILRRKKHVRLECLILNRRSFAQTVENVFALSFLVKDGRVEIKVDKDGSHHVSPRNAPAADSVMSGEVTYRHFVFRFDFKDWKLTMDTVPIGDELMPHRESSNASAASEVEPAAFNAPTTPIRKLSRNRGLVVQKEYIVEDSPEVDDAATRAAGLRCKRKLN